MTIDELLTKAQTAVDRKVGGATQELAEAVLELLDVPAPCGFPSPESYPGEVYITREMPGRYEPDEAQGQAVMLLRAAENARQRA